MIGREEEAEEMNYGQYKRRSYKRSTKKVKIGQNTLQVISEMIKYRGRERINKLEEIMNEALDYEKIPKQGKTILSYRYITRVGKETVKIIEK